MDLQKRNQNRMIVKMRKVIGLFGLILLSTLTFAQNNNSSNATYNDGVASESSNGLWKNWYVGLNAGGTIMQANLRGKPYSWGVGAVFGKQVTHRLGIQANILNGKLHGEGLYGGGYLVNDVNFIDASLLLKLNLNDLIFTKSPKVLREFYLFGGVGLTSYKSKVTNTTNSTVFDNDNKSWVDLANDTTKLSGITSLFLPIGLGMSFNIGNTGKSYITTELAYHYSKDNDLDGGYTTLAGHYIYASLGFVYMLGKTTISPQQITADVIENRVKSSLVKQMDNQIASSIQKEIKPMKDELANQSRQVSDNKVSIAAIREEVATRINALNESLREGVVTAQLPNGTIQTTTVSQMAAGSIPSLTSIYFAFNSLYLTPAMEREIAVIAKMMKKNRGLKCEITGNASNVGSPEYNLMLSEKRSWAVARFLEKEFGIDINRLVVKASGLTDPLAKNLHNINRRVDMQLFW